LFKTNQQKTRHQIRIPASATAYKQ